MVYTTTRKTNRYHLKCIVCQKSFGSQYDNHIKAYPIYHPKKEYPHTPCEAVFYQVLLGIYIYIFNKEVSVSPHEIIKDVPALEQVQLKKDMITWCLSRGYLEVDSFSRIDLPPAMATILQELAEEENLDHLDKRAGAADWLLYQLDHVRGELRPVDSSRMPFKQAELKLGETTLFDKIDTSKVALRKDKRKETEGGYSSSLRSSFDKRRR